MKLGMLTSFLIAQSSAGGQNSYWLPRKSSSIAGEVDWLFNFILIVSTIFFVLIIALSVFFVLRYRRRAGRRPTSSVTHNTPLELVWTIIPTILVCFMFWWGFKAYADMRVLPENAYQIHVYATQWNWQFGYPRGLMHPELHVPANTPVVLTMESSDVIHSFYVPEFRVKQDVVPGRYTKLWFDATHTGEFLVLCAEYCGTSHSDMVARLVVHTPEDFANWLENADPLSKMSDEEFAEYQKDPQGFIDSHPELVGLETPAALGQGLYRKKGCIQCHSLNGEQGPGSGWIGPTFLGLWGSDAPLVSGGTVKVDENYVHESIVNPNAKIVSPYSSPSQMPKILIKEREITMIIEYLKTLKEEK